MLPRSAQKRGPASCGLNKPAQGPKGRKVAIPHGEIACPVAALKAWLEAASITEGAVFRGDLQ
jgi:hypothetical protein